MKQKLFVASFIVKFLLINHIFSSSDTLDFMHSYIAIPAHQPCSICIPENIDHFYREAGINSLPVELRNFILRFPHDVFPCYQIITPHSISAPPQIWIQDFKSRELPEGWLPFCKEGTGDYYCINVNTGEVRYWYFFDQQFSNNPNDQWGSFLHWVKEVWLPLIEDNN